MSHWTVDEIRESLCEVEVFAGTRGPIIGASIDSRQITPGNIFICLPGEKSDGRDFISDALDAGAAAIVAEAGRPDVLAQCQESGASLFLVPDPMRAISQLAVFHRSRLKGTVIAVTGSNGKTSAKEMLHGMGCVLFGKDKVCSTPGNLNNHIGLPLSLLFAKPEHELIVLEMGMNHHGEISELSKIARPHLALITSVSAAHIEFFSSVEDIAMAKLEIVDGMQAGGFLAINERAVAHDMVQKKCKDAGIACVFFALPGGEPRVSLKGISFPYSSGRVENPNYFNPVMAWNLLGAMELLRRMGINEERLFQAAREARPRTDRRFQLFTRKTANGYRRYLADDTYNANEESFCSALASMRMLLPHGNLTLIAGEMGELGGMSDQAHDAVGLAAARGNFNTVLALGGAGAERLALAYQREKPDGIVLRASSAREWIEESNLDEFVDGRDGILVKGSRFAGTDRIADAIKKLGYA